MYDVPMYIVLYIYIQGDGEIKWAHTFDQVDDDL